MSQSNDSLQGLYTFQAELKRGSDVLHYRLTWEAANQLFDAFKGAKVRRIICAWNAASVVREDVRP